MRQQEAGDKRGAAGLIRGMAVTFGLLAALLWGVTDFLIRVIGRSVGVHRSMLYAQGVGAVPIGLWLACNPAARWPLHDPSPTALAAALGASPLGVLATLALYRGLQVGRVGLVSPIAGAYGAVTAALSLAGGETIGRAAVAGIAAVVVGGLLVSIPARDASGARDGSSPDGRAGALWAIAACIGFGVQFWVQGRFAAPQLSAVVPVGIYYAFSTLALAVAAVIRRPPLALSPRDAASVLGTGAVAVLGFVAVSAGLATGQVAIVTVLSSLQSAITVGLACALLGEQLARHQWLGSR